MSQHPFIEFPVGERPGWEIEHGKGEDLKSIADSLTLYQSLRQSRNRWIYSTFPKFWSKGRGKLTSETAPSNSHCFRAKFELEIGPHIFPDTILYEVQYTPPQSSSSSANQAHTSNTWRSTPYVHYLPQNQLAAGTTPPIIASTPTSQARSNNPAPSSYSVKPNSSPVVSSLTTVTPITPALISKVNTAAATNPILANLLHLAAAGRASPDQLKTLGLLIQSLSDTPPEPNLVERSLPVPSHSHPLAPYNAAHSPSIAAQQPQTPVPPVKDFDLILEFQNLPTERWLLPRGPVVCHKLPGEFPTDIFLTVRVPLGTDETLAEKPDCPMPQAVVFCLKTVPLLVWDTLVRWIGGEEKMVANQKILDRLPRHDDTFLAHQIAEGTLLTQLQAVSTGYSMKLIKPGVYAGHRAKRKSTAKKPTTVQRGQGIDEAPTKRPRSSASTPIQCESCKKQDVPLILNGRFCRPCAEARTNRTANALPQPLSTTSQDPTCNN